MVINRRDIKRKRKDNTSNCTVIDESPKRTKVHAQRKFAQGSNVSSPVITPVKDIEKQDKIRTEVIPEPQELLPINRPHTEDFLTFLCFRGTSMLPPNLNFFNTAPVDSREHTQPLKNEPIEICPPLANIGTKITAGTSERPFIAFGVRKRADPIMVSKHMDKKRRHALALQALRRKYQEQKMAKIRAVTISKLSEKTTSKSLVRTRSVTKNETTTKKCITENTRVKIVRTKHVRVTTRSSLKTPLRKISTPIRTQIQKQMCLRSFRGRFIQRELTIKKPKTPKLNIVNNNKKQEIKTNKKDTSSEFSSDDDEPLVKTVKVSKGAKIPLGPKVTKIPLGSKVAKKCAVGPKKPLEINLRVTRANRSLLSPSSRDATIKRKIQISRTLPTKLPFVQLTPAISPKQKRKEIKTRVIKSPKTENDANSSTKSQKVQEETTKEQVKKTSKKIEIIKNSPKTTEKEPKKKLIKPETLAVKEKLPNEKLEDVTETKQTKPKPETPKDDSVATKSTFNKLETSKLEELEVTPVKKLKKIDDGKVCEAKRVAESSVKKCTPVIVPEFTPKQPDTTTQIILDTAKAKSDCLPKKPDITPKNVIAKITKFESSTPTAIAPEFPNKAICEKPEITAKNDTIQVLAQIQEKKFDPDLKSPNKLETVMEKIETVSSIAPAILIQKPEKESEGKKKIEASTPKENTKSPERVAERKKTIKVDLPIEEPKVSQRPSRKTKEAAAIYMEILGHKLVNDGDFSDDSVSIDSFPELPNVRKTEQRENELKANIKSKKPADDNVLTTKLKKEESQDIKQVNKEGNVVNVKNKDLNTDNSSSKKQPKNPKYVETKKISKIEGHKRPTRVQVKKPLIKFSSSDDESFIEEKKISEQKKKVLERLKKTISDSNSDNSAIIKNSSKDNKKQISPVDTQLDNSFSDSDEEPLSKLTFSKIKSTEMQPEMLKQTKSESTMKKENLKQKTAEKKKEEPSLSSGKPKRECTKRPQNYLMLFSSSEDEDKYFHGFIKNERQPKQKKQEPKCLPTPTADLLCKDVDKRFGRGKVNMSTEQIEKWIKDSALAGSTIKKDNQEEKIMDLSIPNIEIRKSEKDDKTETSPPLATITPNIIPAVAEKLVSAKPTEQRKPIFRKERKPPLPKINAFSANNESSVYAFEAEHEDAIKTPFRRPSRRPSSTATSRSEDSSKYEETPKLGKFRFPALIKQDTPKTKQEVSLMLSTDPSNTSIAVQLDLDSSEAFSDPAHTENAIQTDTEDGEQLFYIPLQPGKQTSSQLIQGVAVKLGTKGANGPNQRVVMSAKLVTHTPVGAQKLQKPLTTSTPMYPPSMTVQQAKDCSKAFIKGAKSFDRMSENSEEFKYKIPSSPSASSSSSTRVTKRQHNIKTRIRPLELTPVHLNEFPSGNHTAILVEAPVFHPNDKEFQDPMEYIERIRPQAEKFGICRIVPPSNFKPECKVADDMRFTAYNQYVHKMLHRWGPNFKELMAITKYLETQNIALTHPPWIGGMEIDLPRLYQIVQSLGGLKEVIEKKKWPKVSELMKIPKSAQDRVTKLDDIYCKYLLPYDTLSPAEREKLFDEVETEWAKRESRTLLRSQQKITNQDSSSNSSESDSNDEAEECIVKGRNMALNAFYRIARNTMSMWFKTIDPSPQEVEQEFWKHVTQKQNHICVHSGSIDSGSWGYGFAVSKNSPFARHAWNLKVLTNNSGSVLRSIGPVMGVTVPTLHVGMVFSACCWYRDPHSLPWIEYLHTGGNKIWYGIPDSMSQIFHTTLIKLVPNYCRNKSLWLPSDTAMVPPSLLVENGVSLCRTIQEPGQFIVVFPKAFTSSLSTGYVVSESVYFAPLNWLSCARNVFDELHNSCEPSMFSLEKLLISIACDSRSTVDVLHEIIPAVNLLCTTENVAWKKLEELGLTATERLPLPEAPVKKRKRFQSDSGDYECDVCSKNLFVSWVMESQDGIYCLDHAIEYIEKKKIDLENCKIIFTYNNEELKKLMERIKNTIECKIQKKAAGKNIGISQSQ